MSNKEICRLAHAYLSNKLKIRDHYDLTAIEEMAAKIRIRKSRRGVTRFKRTFPNIDYHGKLDNKTCSYCYPEVFAYNYIGRGRISHKDVRDVFKLAKILGEF